MSNVETNVAPLFARPEPEVDTDRYSPTADDWQEYSEWLDQLDREAMEREFHDANMELLSL